MLRALTRAEAPSDPILRLWKWVFARRDNELMGWQVSLNMGLSLRVRRGIHGKHNYRANGLGLLSTYIIQFTTYLSSSSDLLSCRDMLSVSVESLYSRLQCRHEHAWVRSILWLKSDVEWLAPVSIVHKGHAMLPRPTLPKCLFFLDQ